MGGKSIRTVGIGVWICPICTWRCCFIQRRKSAIFMGIEFFSPRPSLLPLPLCNSFCIPQYLWPFELGYDCRASHRLRYNPLFYRAQSGRPENTSNRLYADHIRYGICRLDLRQGIDTGPGHCIVPGLRHITSISNLLYPKPWLVQDGLLWSLANLFFRSVPDRLGYDAGANRVGHADFKTCALHASLSPCHRTA